MGDETTTRRDPKSPSVIESVRVLPANSERHALVAAEQLKALHALIFLSKEAQDD